MSPANDVSVVHLFSRSSNSSLDALDKSRLSYRRIGNVLDHAIWWAGLALLPLVAIPYGSDKPWWIAGFEFCVFALGMLWLVRGFLAGTWSVAGAKLFVPLLALAAFAVMQTLPLIQNSVGNLAQGTRLQPISADVRGTYDFLFELLALIVLAKIWLDNARNRGRLKWLIYVVVGVAVASAAFGVIRVILQQTSPELVILGQGAGEGFGQFANQDHFSLMLEMALGLVLGFVLGGGVSRQRWLWHAGLVLLLATTIVFTSSRGGVFTMISQVFFLVACFTVYRLCRSRLRLKELGRSRWNFVGRLALSLVLISGLVVAMAIGITQLGGEPLNRRLEKLPGEMSTQDDSARARRIDIWRATGRLIRAHPVAGVGLGGYHTAIPMYHDASGNGVPDWAINSYLDLVAGGGIIGVALVAWCVIVLLLNIRRGLRSGDSLVRAATFGAVGAIFGVAAHSLVDSGLVVPTNAVILFALLVIASANPEARDTGRRLARRAVG